MSLLCSEGFKFFEDKDIILLILEFLEHNRVSFIQWSQRKKQREEDFILDFVPY